LVVLGLALWFVVGVALLMAQVMSFWQYQFLLLSVPAGVLAAFGVDALAGAFHGLAPGTRPRASIALAGGLVLLFAWPIGTVALKVVYLARDRFALTEAGRVRFTNRMSKGSAYFRYRQDVAFVEQPSARPGPIFVVGNPIVNWLSQRP